MAIGIREKSPLAYRKLRDISKEYREFRFRVGGDHHSNLQRWTRASAARLGLFLASKENLLRLMGMTGVEQQNLQRVMVPGGGLEVLRLAEMLEKTVEIRLIEKDERSVLELSFELSNPEVLHGDGSDSDVLVSAGLFEMDTFITATGENETNIMSWVLAKHLMNSPNGKLRRKQGKYIALVNKEDYLVQAATMGSDIALKKNTGRQRNPKILSPRRTDFRGPPAWF